MLVTAILVICIASNPELAPIVPVLDAFGLDVLLYLFAAQLGVLMGGMLLPWARKSYGRVVRRAVTCIGYAINCLAGGYLRQLVWHARNVGLATAALGPNSSFMPNQLRGGLTPASGGRGTHSES
ncbi:hypothetical protein [Pseudoxanthomonas sp. 10H]|uniref:hypothetical protein n=1 Tax=Pseudoxanthomonas sp. 10H TaxID=3242729 RepID=UPI0035567ACB